MSINITDPLALIAIQAGQVGIPATEAAAAGGSTLDTQQRAVGVGEPVPIAFGRRRTVGSITAGGVLISPGATECRFENDTNNNVTAYYHLVLSEGQIDPIPVSDVFQGPCRVGSHSQTYNRRAGTWTPANVIVERPGFKKPEASYYCGSIGAYPGMSTLSYQITVGDENEFFKKQVHCFIRGGMHVTRLYDDSIGPSDNFADLVKWLLSRSVLVPTGLIDTTSLDAAATFLEVNRFTCNCWITESTNYADLLTKWAPYFLLAESNNSGKRGLRPLLPTTESGAIDTSPITPVWTFTEDYIIAGSLQIVHSNLGERRPFVAQVIWRQQLEDDFGIIRTAEVRYSGTAESGPYESHDLSEFCTTENHAVKIGAYILSKRFRTSHTIRFSAKPQANNTLVTVGDIIRVRLAREATTAGTGYHDFLYQVERITKTLEGELSYECTHFPVNAEGVSLIALDVAAAAGTGILLSSNKSGVGCDLNSPNDKTIPSESWSPPSDIGADQTLIDGGYESDPSGDVGNGDDNLDRETFPAGPITGNPNVGGVLTAPAYPEGGENCEFRWGIQDIQSGEITYVSFGTLLYLAPSLNAETQMIVGNWVCDNATYEADPVGPVTPEPSPTDYPYARLTFRRWRKNNYGSASGGYVEENYVSTSWVNTGERFISVDQPNDPTPPWTANVKELMPDLQGELSYYPAFAIYSNRIGGGPFSQTALVMPINLYLRANDPVDTEIGRIEGYFEFSNDGTNALPERLYSGEWDANPPG